MPGAVVVIGTMVVLAGEVLLEATLQANDIDAELETVCHFPSDNRNPTFHRAPLGSPRLCLNLMISGYFTGAVKC